jgi:hypothetical protein
LSRAVAQLGSALDWGSRGRKFKSCQPDTRAVRETLRETVRNNKRKIAPEISQERFFVSGQFSDLNSVTIQLIVNAVGPDAVDNEFCGAPDCPVRRGGCPLGPCRWSLDGAVMFSAVAHRCHQTRFAA